MDSIHHNYLHKSSSSSHQLYLKKTRHWCVCKSVSMKKDTCSIVMHTKYYNLQLLGRNNSSVFSAQQHIAIYA